MIHSVVFDLDGVMVNTEPVYIEVTRDLFRKLGISIPLHEHYKFVGISPWKMWQKIRDQFNLPESVEFLVHMEKREQYKRLKHLNQLKPINGIVDLLEQLKGLRLLIALASSSNHQIIEFVTTALQIRKYFEVVVSGDDVVEGKPAPNIYLKVAELMGVLPESCVAIEDSANGIASAKSAGMYCIGYENSSSGPQDLSGADLVINDFSPGSRAKILQIVLGNGRA